MLVRIKQCKLVTKLNVGMEKEQKQELGWRVSVIPIPAFHYCEPLCVACTVNREIFVLKNFDVIIFRVKIFLYASRPY